MKISLTELKMEIERALYIVFRAFFEELSKTKTKTTPEEGDEGFEGPPCRQSLEEEDASDASKDVKTHSKEVGENDVEILSNKAEIRAEQLAIARAAVSVMSDPEQAGTVDEPLEDGRFSAIVAPGNEEDSEDISEDKIKAKILSAKARGGTEAEMSGYKAFKMTTSLSDKAEVPHEETELSEEIRILSDKARDAQKQEEILRNKVEETLAKKDVEKALDDEEA